MEKSRFPNKLRSYRRSCAYSQKKVARMLGHSDTSMISYWERGIGIPKLMYVFRLAWLYGTQPHNLYEELWSQIGEECSLLVQTNEPINTNQSFYV